MTSANVSSANLLSDRDDLPVLAAAPLRPGFDRHDLSRYGDPSWDLGPAVFRENARRCHVTVHFGSIADPAIAEAIRAYLYARLNIDLPGQRPRLPPACVRQEFNRARRFFEFVRTELGACDIARVDHRLIDRYAKSLNSSGLRPVIAAQLLDIVFNLYAYRNHLGHARLRFEPWPGRSPSLVAGYRFTRGENRTPRIPEQIITPLLAWSLRYVSIFAPDIFAARAELTSLEAHRDVLLAEDAALSFRQRRARQRDRLTAFFEERRRAGRGVPIWTTAHNGVVRRDPATDTVTPPINMHLLHLHVGIDARAEPRMHLQLSTGAPDLIATAVTELGLEIGGMDTPISIDPVTEGPWRPRFDVKTLLHEERMLQAAAYIVCAYLTGMRDCEVQAMRPGCLSLTRSEDGVIDRHRVRSFAYKSKSSRGEPAEWVTIAPVAEAIAVLERLSARPAQARGVATLWPVLSLKLGTKTHVSAEIVRQLNVYRDHLNTLFGTENEPTIPPGPSGTSWRLTTRQFRRTIAWHIANRPFGTIAGMIQYKHASVAAFEGYAGSSTSGFRAEVETQRALGQIDDILDYFDDRRAGGSLSGPAGPRITRELDAAAEALDPLPAMIADRARLRTLLASLGRTLHVGVLADCFFDPSTALCLKRTAATERQAPLTALCEPTRCPNACITKRHRPAWAQAAADAEAMLREKRLSEPQQIALRQDLQRFQAILDGLGPPPT
jgi:integrase